MTVGVNIKVTLNGDFEGLIDFFGGGNSFKSFTKRLRRRITKKLAEQYITAVKAAILAGNVGGPPLAAATSERKGHSSPWVENLDLLNSLTTWEYHNESHRAGVPRNAVNRDGQPLDLIALIMEIGSYRVPARPVFGPEATKLGQQNPQVAGIEGIVEQELRNV